MAQQTIFGKVTDKKGEPLAGVNIAIKNSYDGATTNLKGEYTFETDLKDSISITASYTGFIPQEKNILLHQKKTELNFNLKEKINDLKAVTITAGSFEASDQKKGTVLNAIDMVTTAGSNGDNYSALKTLPGTQQVNDREGLFVRGGTGNETQTFIDGTWVRNAFSTSVPDLGSRGRFSPFIFKGTVFSTGGYSALYGQALSSVLLLETIDLPEKSSANLSITSVALGASIQELSTNKKSSFGGGYNYVNLTPYFYLVRQNISYTHAPTSHQADANFRIKTSKTGMLKFYGYYNRTLIDVRRDNVTSLDYDDPKKTLIDAYSVKNNNTYANLSYKEFLGKNWKINWGSCFSTNKDDIQTRILNQHGEITQDTNFIGKENIQIDNYNIIATTKIVLEKELSNLNTIRFGGEYIYDPEKNNFENISNPPLNYVRILQEHYKSLFAESDIYITNQLAGKIGVRAEHSSLLNRMNFAPRISTAYRFNKNSQVSLAYGIFYQKPDIPLLFKNKNLNYLQADHYVLNYQYQPKGRFLRIEAYYKQYHKLIKTNIYNAMGGENNTGKGYAGGLELFYRDKKTINGIDFWISYSYLNTKREFLNYINYVQPDFAASHVANLVVKKFWQKYMFGLNGTYTFSTGRPYINYNVSDPNNPYANPDLFMTDKTMPYHNLGLSLNYIKNFRKAFTVFVLGVNNPFGIKQIFGYNYATTDLNHDGVLYRKEITPTSKQFVFLGMFMSFGIDRTQEAIDNNL